MTIAVMMTDNRIHRADKLNNGSFFVQLKHGYQLNDLHSFGATDEGCVRTFMRRVRSCFCDRCRAHWEELKRQPFTDEEKKRWAEILHAVWQGIGPDAIAALDDEIGENSGEITPDLIVELVCDAHRPLDYGMTYDEYEFLLRIYRSQEFQDWARKELNY